MMKPLKTKAQVRAEIARQVEDFISQGGQVARVDRGISGRGVGSQALIPTAFEGPKAERTPVNEVVAAIESRRKPKPAPKVSKPKQPRKKMILDDFGQPLRWEWVED